MISVSVVDEATDSLVEAARRLVPQLSSSAPPPTAETMAEIVRSPATVLLVATDEAEGAVLGMLTLVIFRIPTGVRAWVEDVVVDLAARGQGIGEALLRAAVEQASARGAKTVDLTSRPARGAANRLYVRAGFQLRDTNVYRYPLA